MRGRRYKRQPEKIMSRRWLVDFYCFLLYTQKLRFNNKERLVKNSIRKWSWCKGTRQKMIRRLRRMIIKIRIKK